MRFDSLQLYRHLLRQIKLLPSRDMQNYYLRYVRQHFIAHREESSPERIQQLLERGKQDSEWILKKYIRK